MSARNLFSSMLYLSYCIAIRQGPQNHESRYFIIHYLLLVLCSNTLDISLTKLEHVYKLIFKSARSFFGYLSFASDVLLKRPQTYEVESSRFLF